MASATVTLPAFPCPDCGTTVWEVDTIEPKGDNDGLTVAPVPVGGRCANGHPA